MSYLRDTFKELKLKNENDRLRTALKELLAAWPPDSLPPHALCMKVAEAINNTTS